VDKALLAKQELTKEQESKLNDKLEQFNQKIQKT